jgi:hypothetical protein
LLVFRLRRRHAYLHQGFGEQRRRQLIGAAIARTGLRVDSTCLPLALLTRADEVIE